MERGSARPGTPGDGQSRGTDSLPEHGPAPGTPVEHPSFGRAVLFWLKLGLISFGGPAGQISIMHRELVEQRRWVSDERFFNALNYCMLLPGPEAQQLATYIGWLLHRLPGGVAAGALFVIPSVFVLLALSYVYAAFGDVSWVSSAFAGLKPVVVAVVAGAVITIGRKVLKNPAMAAIAASAFMAIFLLGAPFPFIVIGAGIIGFAGGILFPGTFHILRGKGGAEQEGGYVTICDEPAVCHINLSGRRNVMLFAVFALLWGAPAAMLAFILNSSVFLDEAFFFTKAAFLTFGGAYAVLAYIAQAGVGHYGWLTGGQMMDGLGLAETTPGPLIMVVQFVGFMAGWNRPGLFSPLTGAVLGSFVATYFTFLPCFFFIFLGGPYIEKFRGNKKLGSALSAITASVVGVVLNLAVWFGINVLFPKQEPFNLFGTLLCIAAFVAIQVGKAGIIPVLSAGAAVGVIRHALMP